MSQTTLPPWRWECNDAGQATRLVSYAEDVKRDVLYISPQRTGQDRFLVASPSDLALIGAAPKLLRARDAALEVLETQIRNPTPSLMAVRHAIDILRKYGA